MGFLINFVSNNPIVLLIGIGVLTVLLAGALVATGVLLARRYR